MTTDGFNKSAVLILLAFTASLSGCLSESEDNADSSFAADGPSGENTPPSISGNPQTAVNMGDDYSFTPTASDADGDSLTFSVAKLPSWASFDSSTGAIFGQPSLVDVGVYTGITISASDGIDTTDLRSFDLTVSQTALGSMSLSWTAPTENTDGSTLTDLAGYRIYYGLSQGNYPNRVDVDTEGLTTYVVENLIPNTYFVVATSVNSQGVESAYSNVAIKTVKGS